MSRDNLRLLKVADSNIGDCASSAINPEICDGISLICQRIVRRMGFARDPESRALRRRLLVRSALLLSRPQLPPPHSDDSHRARLHRDWTTPHVERARLGVLHEHWHTRQDHLSSPRYDDQHALCRGVALPFRTVLALLSRMFVMSPRHLVS